MAAMVVISLLIISASGCGDKGDPACCVFGDVPAAIVLTDAFHGDAVSPDDGDEVEPDDVDMVDCDRCDGRGTNGRVACRKCKGTGRIPASTYESRPDYKEADPAPIPEQANVVERGGFIVHETTLEGEIDALNDGQCIYVLVSADW